MEKILNPPLTATSPAKIRNNFPLGDVLPAVIRLFILSLLAAPLAHSATPQEEIAAKVPAARAILDAWQAKDPVKAERKLHVILWTPNDRDPAPRFRERLTAALLDIRNFYASEMQRLGFGPRTLRFDHADDGLLRIHLVRGRHPYAHYNGDSGHEIRAESLPTLRAAGIDPDNETLVIFCNMANWDPEKSTITQNSPYYAGGTHRNGTAWQVDSPILDLALLDKKQPMVRDGQYGNISVGRYNSIFIGGICHELGHALGLPHNRERPDEAKAFGTALMGSGNRTYGEQLRGEGPGSFLTLAHGLRLASHPIFSGSFKGADLQPTAIPTDLAIRKDGKNFIFSGKVTADPPVYGVVAYMDPEGGGDYDATTATAVPDAQGRFTLHCNALAPGKNSLLRVVFLQANGVASGFLSATPFRYPYSVAPDGTVNIELIQTSLTLKPLIAALNTNQIDQAKQLAQTPPIQADPKISQIAQRLINATAPRPAPPADAKTLPLSDLPPATVKVGYGRPIRDRLPDQNALLVSGGQLFTHGFYAHAPARHEWNLDGTWKTLTGTAGVAEGYDGSVRFTIQADGKTLWQSPVTKSDKNHPFTIDLTGVKSLILTTDDAGDGPSSDWALWLEPTLTR